MNFLYKAKRKDNGEWIEGDLYTSGRWLNVFNKDATYIGNTELLKEVDPSTICRYTGCEGNGIKKWEKDIFECPDGDETERYTIEWDADALCWQAYAVFDNSFQMALGEFYPSEIYVIGNTFDNPELLKENEENPEPCILQGLEPAEENGQCIGYGKSHIDDEPCEMCKTCKRCSGNDLD